MNRSTLIGLLVGLCVLAGAVERVSSASSSSDVGTNLDDERTYVAAHAYESAPAEAFDTPATSELPANLAALGDVARLKNVAGIGVLYSVRTKANGVMLFDGNGVRITAGRKTTYGSLYWSAVDGSSPDPV